VDDGPACGQRPDHARMWYGQPGQPAVHGFPGCPNWVRT
jgi:hypothetical protein